MNSLLKMRLHFKFARKISWLWVIGIAALLMCLPTEAMACPFCFSSSTEDVLHTYYVSAILLSLLPFGVIGGIAIWLYRNSHKKKQDLNFREKSKT